MSGIFAGLLAGGGASGDASWSYVSMLLSTTSLSNANNNLFVDSSGGFNPISRNGNTTQGSFTPYGADWSNFFDGSGDYFTVPYTTANFDWYTGGVDFTIEYWFFANSLTGTSYDESSISHPTLVGNRSATSTTDYWSFGPIASGTVRFYYYNGGPNTVTSSATITANTWNHIAMTKTSSGITIFVNGVAQTTTAISGTPQSSTGVPLTVAQGNNTSYNGYVSNLRIVRGTAIYSGNFTVPTAPLTAVTNTKLLTCQSNRFIDNSTNALTLTVTGNTSVFNFSPFAPASPGIVYNQSDITNWSGYFDGTGDYLSVANSSANNLGTGDFTIELWFQSNTGTMNTHACLVASYSSPTSGSWAFKAQSGTSGYIEFASYGPSWNDWVTTTNIASDRQWHHCAVTRSGNTLRIFVDGTVRGTWDISGASSFTGGGHPLTTAFMAQDPTSYLNGNLSNVRIVKGTALYTSNFTPPTSALTAISGTVYLTCQNPAFTDNSTNNFVITQSGNPTVTGNSPFNTVGYWSNYFNGGTNYLTTSSATWTQLGTGDFTVEGWGYINAYGTYFPLCDTRAAATLSPWILGVNGSGFADFYYGTTVGGRITDTVAVGLNTWVHLAAVRSGSTITLYVNGVSKGTATYSSAMNGGAATIGRIVDGYYANGYISNFRVVVGTAVYTSNFTPPTTPLTAISGTQVLTCQNGRIIDNSTNNSTITVTGTVSTQSFDPFYTSTIASNGGSMYFDGTGDYLTSPTNVNYDFASSNFTIEGWFYFTNGSANQLQCLYSNYTNFSSAGAIYFGKHSSTGSGCVSAWFSNYSTGSPLLTDPTLPPSNAWTHYALVRNGNTFTLYRNGVSVASASFSGAATSGACPAFIGVPGDAIVGFNYFFLGYMNGFRITKGTAVYTANFTPPTAPLTPSANTTLLLNGMNAGAYDATAINNMETVGNAQVSTVQSKFGGSSFYVPTGCLFIPNSQPLVLGSGNWTVEFWAYTDASGTKVYFDSLNAANTVLQMEIYSSGTSISWVTVGSGTPNITGTGALTANTWQHIAACKSGSSTRLFVNGTQVGSTYTDTATYDTARWEIGSRLSGSFPIVGYIDDLRITKGVARYTANFTAPTAAFPTY